MNTIGIDMGGTRIKGVLINTTTGEVLHRAMVPTKDSEGTPWKGAVLQLIQELKMYSETEVQGVGLAAPGLPNAENTAISSMPGRLQGLEGFLWPEFLQIPVRVLNDAHAALLAEARYGAAQQAVNALMLTLGTGVGGGLLLNGQLYQGYFQMAGHLGHVTVDADSEQLDITSVPGSLEDAIGNVTVSRRSYGRYQTTHELIDGYRQAEPLATLVWLNSVKRLAVTVASMANAFSPEVVIIGGGITQAGDALFGPLQTFMDVFEWRPGGKKTGIRKAHFDEWAGAIGAAGSVAPDQTSLSS